MASNPTNGEIWSELAASLQNGLLIAFVVLCCTALITGLWKAGCFFGRPLGNMIVRLVPQSPPLPEERKATTQRVLGGAIALMLCVIAVATECTLTDIKRLQTGHPQWSWQRFVLVFVKGCFEGIIADAVLAQTVRLLKLE